MEFYSKFNRTFGPVFNPRQQRAHLAEMGRATWYAVRKDPLYPPQFSLTPGGAANNTFANHLNLYAALKAAQGNGDFITDDTVKKLISGQLGTFAQELNEEIPRRDWPQANGGFGQAPLEADSVSLASTSQAATTRGVK